MKGILMRSNADSPHLRIPWVMISISVSTLLLLLVLFPFLNALLSMVICCFLLMVHLWYFYFSRYSSLAGQFHFYFQIFENEPGSEHALLRNKLVKQKILFKTATENQQYLLHLQQSRVNFMNKRDRFSCNLGLFIR